MHADLNIEDLAREIAARIAPDALVDANDIGAMVKRSTRYVTEQMATTPGFPRAIRLTGPGKRRGHPLWWRHEIIAWIKKHEEGKSTRGGRPRNPTE